MINIDRNYARCNLNLSPPHTCVLNITHIYTCVEYNPYIYIYIYVSFDATNNGICLLLAAGLHMRNSNCSMQTPASLFSSC